MLTLEDYIGKRKKEDCINEFNRDCRQDNLRTCVNYVFEYFNTYLNVSIPEQLTVLKDENAAKYRQSLSQYDPDLQDWLVNNYIESGKQVNKSIMTLLAKDQLFFLASSEREFREISYEIYPKIVKRIPTIKGQAEMIYQFIKEYHRVKSYENDFNKFGLPYPITKWLNDVRNKYRVDVALFAFLWAIYFFDHVNLWPQTHKIKNTTHDHIPYDYDYKQASNLFNLDDLYRSLTKKVFLRGHKQEIELLLMYFWLHDIDKNIEYWAEYLVKVMPAIEKKHEKE
ncbi:MAG: hypothetical protein K0Q87_1717 [Neobacillus sp.]|jgi:hypothetical protein|nr:hypothetical protein [Neobacillus sp.]